ncbi:hypothetical protein AcV7_004202 [Taiwanofungus camphoratus]|nr:hypothetical protein AcV7_004202 [Antrodia cinnamomea]
MSCREFCLDEDTNFPGISDEQDTIPCDSAQEALLFGGGQEWFTPPALTYESIMRRLGMRILEHSPLRSNTPVAQKAQDGSEPSSSTAAEPNWRPLSPVTIGSIPDLFEEYTNATDEYSSTSPVVGHATVADYASRYTPSSPALTMDSCTSFSPISASSPWPDSPIYTAAPYATLYQSSPSHAGTSLTSESGSRHAMYGAPLSHTGVSDSTYRSSMGAGPSADARHSSDLDHESHHIGYRRSSFTASHHMACQPSPSPAEALTSSSSASYQATAQHDTHRPSTVVPSELEAPTTAHPLHSHAAILHDYH